ncbi:MAG: hypothetical protein Kow00121_51630 [Elainellaceae cyanobacterium]
MILKLSSPLSNSSYAIVFRFCRFQSQQEAQAFFEHNSSEQPSFGPDNDGLACETLSATLRTDGSRILTSSTSDGWRYEVWQTTARTTRSEGETTVYYIRAAQNNDPSTTLTTGNFSSQTSAINYFNDFLR